MKHGCLISINFFIIGVILLFFWRLTDALGPYYRDWALYWSLLSSAVFMFIAGLVFLYLGLPAKKKEPMKEEKELTSTTRKCKQCGAEIAEADKICPKCGVEFEEE